MDTYPFRTMSQNKDFQLWSAFVHDVLSQQQTVMQLQREQGKTKLRWHDPQLRKWIIDFQVFLSEL